MKGISDESLLGFESRDLGDREQGGGEEGRVCSWIEKRQNPKSV